MTVCQRPASSDGGSPALRGCRVYGWLMGAPPPIPPQQRCILPQQAVFEPVFQNLNAHHAPVVRVPGKQKNRRRGDSASSLPTPLLTTTPPPSNLRQQAALMLTCLRRHTAYLHLWQRRFGAQTKVNSFLLSAALHRQSTALTHRCHNSASDAVDMVVVCTCECRYTGALGAAKQKGMRLPCCCYTCVYLRSTLQSRRASVSHCYYACAFLRSTL